MESHPYTKPRGVGPVTTELTSGAEPASSKSAGASGPWSCSPTCRAWSESSVPSFTDSISTGAGCTCSPCNTGAGSTWSPCNKMSGHSAFLHKQLDVTVAGCRLSERAKLTYNPISRLICTGAALLGARANNGCGLYLEPAQIICNRISGASRIGLVRLASPAKLGETRRGPAKSGGQPSQISFGIGRA